MVFLFAIDAAGGIAVPDAIQEIRASDILNQIKDGAPVYYDGVNVSGNLDLSGFDKVNSSLTIINSSIVKPRLPLTVFGPIQGHSLGLGIDIKDVLPAPGFGFWIVLI